MAGHNKWSKIKHKKAGTDAQKSKVFGRLAKVLTVESKNCGGDRGSPALKSAIEQAKAANMPAQNINRAIERGVGGNAESLETITYEMYGPGGCALLINALTDNKNRTAAEIRHIITKNGYTVGTPGSAAWIFTKQEGRIVPSTTVSLSEADAKKLDALVAELDEQEDTQEILTNKV
ncbi:MAG: YebC/PmpR family DNA-binding transcriptional regulator [Candidatus Kaiserbacteria bacterium]|nr:YebC/PmpR family DNA-binding transcriptional regulator [Candidatus Kaiserbacteria bacterium]